MDFNVVLLMYRSSLLAWCFCYQNRLVLSFAFPPSSFNALDRLCIFVIVAFREQTQYNRVCCYHFVDVFRASRDLLK